MRNVGTLAVDVSGWQLTGGIDYTFKPGTVIASGSSVFVTPDVVAFRSRTEGPSGGQGLFIQDAYQGHLSNEGETVELRDVAGEFVAELNYTGDVSDVQRYLRVTEVMYNPAPPTLAELSLDPLFENDDFEFIEIQNTSTSTTLDLSGVAITAGPSVPFSFTGSSVTSLAPGERTLVVRDLTAFESRYGAGHSIAGEYIGNLSNGGEILKVEDASNSTVVEFEYSDGFLWPAAADGVGASLELVNAEATPTGELGKYYRWRGSTEYLGTPGTMGSGPVGVVISEILANTDAPAITTDSIELHNGSAEAVDLGGWFLSDSANAQLKYEIPAGTILEPGAYIVFDEQDFNVGASGFALSGSDGDQVWLVATDGSGNVTALVDNVEFGATRTGETLGRGPTTADRLAPQGRATLGCDNYTFRVGPVVISEINYHPDTPSTAALAIDPSLDANDLEFIEIHNPTSQLLDLTDWRVRGGVDYEFDDGLTLAAGGTLVVVPFNPDNVGNEARVAAFRVHYGISESVTMVGGYTGTLNDSFDRVELQRPDDPPAGQPSLVPHTSEDMVVYDDLSPWPVSADGSGDSLNRRLATLLGDAAETWTAAAPSPGMVAFATAAPGDVDGNGSVTAADIDLLLNAIRAASKVAIYDLDGSGVVDEGDLSFLLEDAFDSVVGDMNLDGAADATDFGIWQNYRFTGCGTWTTGDVTGDGVVDGRDFNVWFSHRFTAPNASPSTSGRSVPRAALVDQVAALPDWLAEHSGLPSDDVTSSRRTSLDRGEEGPGADLPLSVVMQRRWTDDRRDSSQAVTHRLAARGSNVDGRYDAVIDKALTLEW
ncbi:MAG: lamin tail domain-containing protein [Planctomycetales bacterium]|nr:lamin tail domain-containing protein [Planctomycetales bacterium]